jgi:predicted transposase YbfD/YdcC
MKDPRRISKGNIKYSLNEIVFLVISAVVSGVNEWDSIEIFGQQQIDWLRKFFPYKKGIPSHDTLSRFFSALDSQYFSKYFLEWTNSVCQIANGEIVAIDGKRMRGSYDTASEKAAIHMVSAFAAGNNLCLGQVKTKDKSNEITAIPELLELLSIKGATVTIDAMGCQKAIAEKILGKNANYLLAVKDNQQELLAQIEKLFTIQKIENMNKDVDCGHGRVETRICSVIDDFKFFDDYQDWPGLKSVVRIETERYTKITGKTEYQTRYYISSLPPDATYINNAVRSHWAIENKLHWILDVQFREDSSRKRMGNSAANFNIISKIALGLIERVETKRTSKRGRRVMAAFGPTFREEVLGIF